MERGGRMRGRNISFNTDRIPTKQQGHRPEKSIGI
jgi:hypothetical protein